MRITPTTPIAVERDSGSFQIRAQRPRIEAGGLATVWLMATRLDANGREKSCHQTAAQEKLFRRFQREPNDIGERASVARDDEIAVFLNRIPPRLVQCVHAPKILLNRGVVESLERDVTGDPLIDPEIVDLPANGEAGEHRVRPSAQSPEH